MSSGYDDAKVAIPPPYTLLIFNRLKDRVDAILSTRPVPGTITAKSTHMTIQPIYPAPSDQNIPSFGASVVQGTKSFRTSEERDAPYLGPDGVVMATSMKIKTRVEVSSPSGKTLRPTYRKNAPYRIAQFETLLNADVIDMVTFRNLCWNGIPSQYRPIAWPFLLNYHPSKGPSRSYYSAQATRISGYDSYTL